MNTTVYAAIAASHLTVEVETIGGAGLFRLKSTIRRTIHESVVRSPLFSSMFFSQLMLSSNWVFRKTRWYDVLIYTR